MPQQAPQHAPTPSQQGWQGTPQQAPTPPQQGWQGMPQQAPQAPMQQQGWQQPNASSGGYYSTPPIDTRSMLAGTAAADPAITRHPSLAEGDHILVLRAADFTNRKGNFLRIEWEVVASPVHRPGSGVNVWISYQFPDAGKREVAALVRALAPTSTSGISWEQLVAQFAPFGLNSEHLALWSRGEIWTPQHIAAADQVIFALFGTGSCAGAGMRVMARCYPKNRMSRAGNPIFETRFEPAPAFGG